MVLILAAIAFLTARGVSPDTKHATISSFEFAATILLGVHPASGSGLRI